MTRYKIGVEAVTTHEIVAESAVEAIEAAKEESSIPSHLVSRSLVMEESR